jgi:predicted transcriptional regulator
MLPTLTRHVLGVNMKNTILHMKINEDLKERLRKLAEQDGRNLSNLIQKVLSDYAAQKEGELRSPRSASPP